MSETPKRKLSPEEVLDAIEQSEADDEADRILGLSDEELDSELKESGFDPAQVRAEGAAIAERMMRATAEKKAEAEAAKPPAEKVEPAQEAAASPSPAAGGDVVKLPTAPAAPAPLSRRW